MEEKVEVNERLTAEEVFEYNNRSNSLHTVGGGIDVGPAKKLTKEEKAMSGLALSERERLRLRGLIRIHQMANTVLYDAKCSGPHPPAIKVVVDQFEEWIPKDVRDRALDLEARSIASIEPYSDKYVQLPGGWKRFCSIVDLQIKEGWDDDFFSTHMERANNGG
jgi:hypothetical protein